MAEFFSEAIKSLVEQYIEWAKAPGEAAELIRTFGGHDERVLYQGYARYWNSQQFLDRPLGVILVTNARFIFLAKQAIPLVKSTKSLVIPLGAVADIQCVKYRLGHTIDFMVSGRKYRFMLANMHTFVSREQYESVTRILLEAKANVA
jgi:hypothetical protein